MKASIYQTIILILLVNVSSRMNAQNSLLSNEHIHFTLNEKQHSKSTRKLPQAITTNNYDLKYHRFNWFIDPAQRYISGSLKAKVIRLTIQEILSPFP